MPSQELNNASKAYWLSFAVSRYAKSKNLTPNVVFPKLRKFGVMDFLDKHYETEHLEKIDLSKGRKFKFNEPTQGEMG